MGGIIGGNNKPEIWSGKNKADVQMLHQKNLANGPNLTAREHEILEYIAQGLSTKEVAQLIDIAPRTIDRHVENARLKLRAKNRTHMVACAVMEGLLKVEDDDGLEAANNGVLYPDE